MFENKIPFKAAIGRPRLPGRSRLRAAHVKQEQFEFVKRYGRGCYAAGLRALIDRAMADPELRRYLT